MAVVVMFELVLLLRKPSSDGFYTFLPTTEILIAFGMLALITVTLIYLPKYFKLLPSSLSVLLVLVLAFFFLKPYSESLTAFAARYETQDSEFVRLSMLNLPPLNFETHQIVVPYAAIIFITGIIMSLNLLSFTDELTNTRGKANRETISLGVINIVCGFLGGMPVAGSLPLTMVGLNAGTKGRISGLVSAVLVGGVVFFSPTVLSFIPAFAAIGLIFIILVETFVRASFYSFKKIRFLSAVILISVAVATVLVNLTVAILAGIVISFIVFAWEIARMIRVRKRIDDQGAKYYEIYGPLFFGSVPVFNQKFVVEDDPEVVVFDFYESKVMDYEGAKALFNMIGKYREAGKTVKLKFISSDMKRLITKEKVDVEIIEGGEDDPKYTILIDELS